MVKKINIAIDGFSSCGKSTIAKAICEKYSMKYIDTGSMYRAVTLYCIDNGIILNSRVDVELLLSSLSDIHIDFKYDRLNRNSETLLNGVNVEGRIRRFDVSDKVSDIAKIQQVRSKLVKMQRDLGEFKNVVMDGRDIGTKVFPNAEIKFFVTADINQRAERRYQEILNKKEKISYSQVLENIKKRDDHDSNRDISPLIMADDAVLLDNTSLDINDQNDFIFRFIDKIIYN